MTELTIVILLVLGLIAMLDWRQGLAMCVLIGIAQDPLRKLTPHQPVYFVVLVGVIFGIAWIRAYLVGVRLTPASIQGGLQKHLRLPFSLFLFVVLAQALHSFITYGSATMTGIGLLVWLAPIPAVVLAYQYAIRGGLNGIRRWMLVYVLTAFLALSGVYLEYMGVRLPTLGEIGEGQVIYDVGAALKAHSGFFRASEIAAWHTAAIACFVFILSVEKRPTLIRMVTALGMIALLVSLGILTGRRKLLVEITVFLSCYLFLVAWLQRGAARLAVAVLAAGAVGYIAIVGFVAPDLVQRSYTKHMTVENAHGIEGYAVRGQSVFTDLPSRVSGMGVDPVVWAVGEFGWLGAGLGAGSQGANEIAQAHKINRSASEGGLGKITMELGVPGLLVVAWLVFSLGKHLRGLLIATGRMSPKHARAAYGFVSFLAANAATFTVATQAYSDLFVLLILGWTFGFLLAMPVLAAMGDSAKKKRAAAPSMPPAMWQGGGQPAGVPAQLRPHPGQR